MREFELHGKEAPRSKRPKTIHNHEVSVMTEEQSWRRDSRDDSSSATSWGETSGHVYEIDMPLDLQIRLLAQEANFHRIADEALYVRRLRSHGLGETAALDTYRFVQIALGRCLPVVRNVPFTDTFYRFDAEGRTIEIGRLSEQPLFLEAVKLVRRLFTRRAGKVIGYSSSEVRSALAQMTHGVSPRNLNLRPCLLFTATPDPALVSQIKRRFDGSADAGNHVRPVRPWWGRWKAGSLRVWVPRMLGR